MYNINIFVTLEISTFKSMLNLLVAFFKIVFRSLQESGNGSVYLYSILITNGVCSKFNFFFSKTLIMVPITYYGRKNLKQYKSQNVLNINFNR